MYKILFPQKKKKLKLRIKEKYYSLKKKSTRNKYNKREKVAMSSERKTNKRKKIHRMYVK